jgi:hypothetical protein
LSQFALFGEWPRYKEPLSSTGKNDRETQTKDGNGCVPFGRLMGDVFGAMLGATLSSP